MAAESVQTCHSWARPFTTALLLYLCLFSNPLKSKAQSVSVSLRFELQEAATTSAGIYSTDSILIRTLWSNVRYAAGVHTVLWDRKDDFGKLANDGSYVLKVMSNNIRYTWEGGHIGNTSDSMTGSSKHRYFSRPNSMAISGNYAYYTSGYAEGITSAYKFKLGQPQNKIAILNGAFKDVDQMGYFSACDGQYVFWAGIDPFNTKVSFVYASSTKTDSEITFTGGNPLPMTYGRTYASALDIITDNDTAHPSGLAVQKKGKFLFVAHQKINQVHVFDKRSGVMVQNLNFKAPRQMTVDTNDQIWMLTESNTIKQYVVGIDGTLTSAGMSVTGTLDPLALAVSPDNAMILVADGGSSQQLKAFSLSTGQLLWTLGSYGGYASDPAVNHYKFFFSHRETEIRGTFIAFQPDHSFWVGDPGNERIQHFSADRTFIENIMSLPHSYSVVADCNNPTRVFNEYLEFAIDYSKPLSANNGSWTLVRNWRYGVEKPYYKDFRTNIFRNVITLGNGKTYATLTDWSVADQPRPEIIELPAAANIRYTGLRLNAFENFVLESDGTLITLEGDGNPGKQAVWHRQTLTGFDQDNNPLWAGRETDLISPAGVQQDPLCDGLSQPVKTSGGIYPVFNAWVVTPQGKGKGFRLGALKKGKSEWLWLTSKSTSTDYHGPMPSDGTFDAGNGVQYPGGNVYVIDKHILWNYHGEFWKNSQTNIWNHYFENGLMAGQFGITSPDGENISPEAFPMGAGNVFSSALVKVGPDLFLYHNDESVHAAIHRWKISGLNSIREQSYTILLQSPDPGGLKVQYFEGSDMNNTRLVSVGLIKQIGMDSRPSEIKDTVPYSAIFSGYIRADSSSSIQFKLSADKGIRLWFDDTMLINAWQNNTQTNFLINPLSLQKNKYYSIRIEAKGGPFRLYRMNKGLPEAIPAQMLIPDSIHTDRTWINLLENLPYSSVLEDGKYGWFRFPAENNVYQDGRLCLIRTNIKTSEKEKRDIDVVFRDSAGSCFIRRAIHNVSDCSKNWLLRGTINLQGNSPDFGDIRFYIDVKDKLGKTICRITQDLINIQSLNENNIRIRFNGDDVMNLPLKKMYQALNFPVDFTIRTENNYCDFQFFNQLPMRSAVLDKDADWAKPAYIEFHFSGSDQLQRKEINISRLEIKTKLNPIIYFPGADSACADEDIILETGESAFYRWNTGETTRRISVNRSGFYSVSGSDDKICWETSAQKQIIVFETPKPMVEKNGNNLLSGYSSGNQWFYNDTIIPGARFQQLQPIKKGYYRVMVTDSNGCTGISEAFEYWHTGSDADILNDVLQIVPNPNNGRFCLNKIPTDCAQISIVNVNGVTVYTAGCADRYIELPDLASGIYIVLLRSEHTIIKQKLSVLH